MAFLSQATMIALLSACAISRTRATPATRISLSSKLNGLGQITDIQHAPNDDRLFIVIRQGLIKVVQNPRGAASVLSTPFLDISSRVATGGGEQGLLGLAFHPDFATNRYLFVNYIFSEESVTRISRFEMPTGGGDPTELVIAQIPQPYSNHNAGQLQFADDGYLYIGLGDGGSGGDPQDYAENLNSYLGKMLRVNVDTLNPDATGGVGNPRWTIPDDNPDNCGLEGTIAYGLRNPWRFAFDKETGDMWIGDVGQGTKEEVSYVKKSSLLSSCLNFGWDPCEGTFLHEAPLPNGCSSCSDPSCFQVPVVEYGRSVGRSITGGYVYRGTDFVDELDGVYFYADYATGHVWGARATVTGTYVNEIQELSIATRTSTFGQDSQGELFLGTLEGNLYRVEPEMFNGPTPSPITGPTPSPPEIPVVECPTLYDIELDVTPTLSLSLATVMFSEEEFVIAHGGVLCVKLVYQGEAWLAFGVSPTGNMDGDAIIGVPGDGVQKYSLSSGAVGLSSSQTLTDSRVEQDSGTTTLTFGKLLKEDGEIEINGNGRNIFLWAHGGSSNTLESHSQNDRGSLDIVLSGTFVETCPIWLVWLNWLQALIRFFTFGFINVALCPRAISFLPWL